MDDDFYLLKKFRLAHYWKGRMSIYANQLKEAGAWGACVYNSYLAYPKAKRHCLHVPLPIHSETFMSIAERHPERHEAPSYVPRQIYCANETRYDRIRLKKDVKLRCHVGKKIEGLDFFSIANNMKINYELFDSMYKNISEYEK